jgi:hypothetical protein
LYTVETDTKLRKYACSQKYKITGTAAQQGPLYLA